jgi:O-antigen/teichoic acid export membrane protein
VKRGEVARNVTRGAFFLGLERGIASLSTILYSALIARWLGPGQYGLLTLAFSMVSLATGIAGNADLYLERFSAEYQVRDRLATLRRAFGIALGFKLALGLVAAVALVVLAPRLADWYDLPELAILLPLLSAFIVSDGFSSTGRAMLFGLQRYEWVSGLSLIFNIGRSVLAVLLWDTHHGVRALAIGLSALTVAQALMIAAVSMLVLRRARAARPLAAGPEPPVEPGLPRQMLAYCAPLFGANLSFLSGQNIGKLVLGMVLTPADLGFFAFAFGTVERIVEVVYTLPRALLPSLTQIVAGEDRERLHYVFGQAFRLVQVVACVVSLLIFVFAREIVFAMGGPMFQRAIPMLRILALVPIVRTAQQPLTMLFQASRRPGYVLSLALVKLLTEVAGWIALVILLRMGAPGACWANVLGAVTAFAGAMWLGRTLLPEGSGERLGAMMRSIALVLPLELLVLAGDRWLGAPFALGLRVLVPVVAFIGLFPLGLVVAYDLEKVSSLPLPGTWLGRRRDGLVSVTDALIRTFGSRRPV